MCPARATWSNRRELLTSQLTTLFVTIVGCALALPVRARDQPCIQPIYQIPLDTRILLAIRFRRLHHGTGEDS